MSFKNDFYKLVEKYKSLPYLDEHVEIKKKGKYYGICLEIEERNHFHNKPTHKNVESLIQYLVANKDDNWTPADDPSNSPQLIGFTNLNDENPKYVTISLQKCTEAKMFSKEILQEFKRRICGAHK